MVRRFMTIFLSFHDKNGISLSHQWDCAVRAETPYPSHSSREHPWLSYPKVEYFSLQHRSPGFDKRYSAYDDPTNPAVPHYLKPGLYDW